MIPADVSFKSSHQFFSLDFVFLNSFPYFSLRVGLDQSTILLLVSCRGWGWPWLKLMLIDIIFRCHFAGFLPWHARIALWRFMSLSYVWRWWSDVYPLTKKQNSTCSTVVRILRKVLAPASFEPFQVCCLVASRRGWGCTWSEVTSLILNRLKLMSELWFYKIHLF